MPAPVSVPLVRKIHVYLTHQGLSPAETLPLVERDRFDESKLTHWLAGRTQFDRGAREDLERKKAPFPSRAAEETFQGFLEGEGQRTNISPSRRQSASAQAVLYRISAQLRELMPAGRRPSVNQLLAYSLLRYGLNSEIFLSHASALDALAQREDARAVTWLGTASNPNRAIRRGFLSDLERVLYARGAVPTSTVDLIEAMGRTGQPQAHGFTAAAFSVLRVAGLAVKLPFEVTTVQSQKKQKPVETTMGMWIHGAYLPPKITYRSMRMNILTRCLATALPISRFYTAGFTDPPFDKQGIYNEVEKLVEKGLLKIFSPSRKGFRSGSPPRIVAIEAKAIPVVSAYVHGTYFHEPLRRLVVDEDERLA